MEIEIFPHESVKHALKRAHERAMEEDQMSHTTILDHIHDCECGGWVCNDETCDVDERGHGGWRDCPFCEEER